MSLEGRRNRLRALPSPTVLTGEPWALRTTKQVADLLGIDPACLTVWRYRGVGPEIEPPYFTGTIQAYRLDRVSAWLAARRGERYDQAKAWTEAFEKVMHPTPGKLPDLVAEWVKLSGPSPATPPGAQWRRDGFPRYLSSLAATRFDNSSAPARTVKLLCADAARQEASRKL